jgi:hypothetical protein
MRPWGQHQPPWRNTSPPPPQHVLLGTRLSSPRQACPCQWRCATRPPPAPAGLTGAAMREHTRHSVPMYQHGRPLESAYHAPASTTFTGSLAVHGNVLRTNQRSTRGEQHALRLTCILQSDPPMLMRTVPYHGRAQSPQRGSAPCLLVHPGCPHCTIHAPPLPPDLAPCPMCRVPVIHMRYD